MHAAHIGMFRRMVICMWNFNWNEKILTHFKYYQMEVSGIFYKRESLIFPREERKRGVHSCLFRTDFRLHAWDVGTLSRNNSKSKVIFYMHSAQLRMWQTGCQATSSPRWCRHRSVPNDLNGISVPNGPKRMLRIRRTRCELMDVLLESTASPNLTGVYKSLPL